MSSFPGTARVVVADDHPVFRAGVRAVLEDEPGFALVGEATNGADAVRLVEAIQPDLLLLDVAMPGGTGLDVLAELRRRQLAVRTLIVTAGLSREQLVSALRLGARGIVPKDSVVDLLLEAMRGVLGGRFWIDREAVDDVVQAFARIDSGAVLRGSGFGLTPRELDVVRLVVEACSNREIAARLSVTEDTVKHHLSSIYDKTGVSTRLELAMFALRHRLDQRGLPDEQIF